MLILCIELPLILINLLYLVPVWAAVHILDGDVNWWWKKDGGNSLIYFHFYFLYDLVGKSCQNIVLELSDLAAQGWKWICLTWRISEPLVRGGCWMACTEMWMRNWAEASWDFGNCQVWKTETNAECHQKKRGELRIGPGGTWPVLTCSSRYRSYNTKNWVRLQCNRRRKRWHFVTTDDNIQQQMDPL